MQYDVIRSERILQIVRFTRFLSYYLGKPQKSFFLVESPLRPLAPPPHPLPGLGLVDKKTFSFFSLFFRFKIAGNGFCHFFFSTIFGLKEPYFYANIPRNLLKTVSFPTFFVSRLPILYLGTNLNSRGPDLVINPREYVYF